MLPLLQAPAGTLPLTHPQSPSLLWVQEFRKVVIGAFVFILMLSVWVVSFRYGDDAYRAASSIVLMFIVSAGEHEPQP